MSERKIIKHYNVPLYEKDMEKLKALLGDKTTTHDALTAAVEFANNNMISNTELIRMAELEKKRGGKHGKQNI